MYRMTVKAWASILLCALFFAAAAAKPAYASESGDAVQQIPAAQETSAEQQSAEPDPSIPLRITAIDFGWEGWGDGTMIESKGECMLMDTFMPDCEDTLKEFLLDNGYTEFSLYLSHFHADHFGNMRNIGQRLRGSAGVVPQYGCRDQRIGGGKGNPAHHTPSGRQFPGRRREGGDPVRNHL